MKFVGFIKNGKPIIRPIDDSITTEISIPNDIDHGTCIVQIKMLGYNDDKMMATILPVESASKYEIDNTAKLFNDNGFDITKPELVEFMKNVDIKLIEKLRDKKSRFIYTINSFLENPVEVTTTMIYKSIVELRMASSEIDEKGYHVNFSKLLSISDSGKIRIKPCIHIGDNLYSTDEIISEFMRLHVE